MTECSVPIEPHSAEWVDLARAYLARRIDVDAAGCWIPRLKPDRHGYVRSTFRYQHYYLHRLAYEAFTGPVPDGLTIDHLCRNTVCCNPDHLEAVTVWENTRRSTNFMAQRSRQTHCLRGHAYTPENTRTRGRARSCWTCHKEQRNATMRRLRAEDEA